MGSNLNSVRMAAGYITEADGTELDAREEGEYIRLQKEDAIRNVVPSVSIVSITDPADTLKNTNQTVGHIVNKVDSIPPPWKETTKTRSEFFISIQSWTGVVDEIIESGIAVTLTSDREKNEDLKVVINYNEIDDDDRKLARPGAIFYWRIGYLQGATGRRRTSVIRFRRLPCWTDTDEILAEKEADRLYELFDSDIRSPC